MSSRTKSVRKRNRYPLALVAILSCLALAPLTSRASAEENARVLIWEPTPPEAPEAIRGIFSSLEELLGRTFRVRVPDPGHGGDHQSRPGRAHERGTCAS